MSKPFLEAEWRKLLMFNYTIDAELLKPHVPHKTELDFWNGNCYVSLVGFMFLNTKLKGFKVPFHTNFEEVNLRFYVKYKDGETWKRGVVFIKEIVPKPALTFVANIIYNENYETMPMDHHWEETKDTLTVEYRWKQKTWHSIKATASNSLRAIQAGSEDEFITEHYWGYTQFDDKETSEYQVEHPRWDVYPVHDYHIDVNFSSIYGFHFKILNELIPKSVFLAEGSDIKVNGKRVL